jgi:hypothetical protein
MTPMKILVVALFVGAAQTAMAQSVTPTTPSAPAGTPVVKLQAPLVAPPPPRPAPLIPASQRTPTPPISLKAAPTGGAPLASVRPDTTRLAARAVPAPAARVASPPRRAPVATASTVSRNLIPATEAPPIGATMRCKDGTYLTGAGSTGRCANNGGVAAMYPALPASPPAPRPQPQRKQP